MTVLTDTDLIQIIVSDMSQWSSEKDSKLLIENFNDKNLTPIGYDLCVGNEFIKMKNNIKRGNLNSDNDELTIKSNEIVAIRTYENICMPKNKNISGIVVSKVSMVEKGLNHISTSIDPDWEGCFIVTISNNSNRKISLKYKQPFCTAMFLKNQSSATRDSKRHPDTHLESLRRAWEKNEKIPISTVLNFSLVTIIGFSPLLYLLLKNIYGSLSSTEIPIFVSLSVFILSIVNIIFKFI